MSLPRITTTKMVSCSYHKNGMKVETVTVVMITRRRSIQLSQINFPVFFFPTFQITHSYHCPFSFPLTFFCPYISLSLLSILAYVNSCFLPLRFPHILSHLKQSFSQLLCCLFIHIINEPPSFLN